MSGTDELAEFLAARYDEAEAQVNDRLCIHCGIPTCELRHALGVYGYTHGTAPDWDGWQGRRCPGRITGAEPVQNPAHRLADIALKRAILALHTEDPPGGFGHSPGNCRECSCDGALAATDCFYTVDYPCPTVRQLGTEFDGHAGYKPEWAPAER